MKRPIPYRRIGALCLLTALAHPALAQDDPVTFSGSVSAGIGSDSNVGIPELDQTTGEGDLSYLFSLEGNVEADASERLTLRAGYELAHTGYQDYDEFSLQTHRGSLEAVYDFDVVEAGLLYNYVHARLDGEGYLNYQQISPYVTHLAGDRVFLRGALEFTDKDFQTDDARDAEGQGVRGDVYYFIDGASQYVSLTGRVREEDANSDLFDFTGMSVDARYNQDFTVLDRSAELRIGGGYESREYDGVDPLISDARSDDILSAQTGLEFELAGPLALDVDYSYRDRQSNLPSADYDEHVAELRLRASF